MKENDGGWSRSGAICGGACRPGPVLTGPAAKLSRLGGLKPAGPSLAARWQWLSIAPRRACRVDPQRRGHLTGGWPWRRVEHCRQVPREVWPAVGPDREGG